MGISIAVDLFHHYQKLRDLIGQFAFVDESKDINSQWSRTEIIVSEERRLAFVVTIVVFC